MRKSLTSALKKQITQKWNEQFPGLGVYKPMWLMNICGPLAVGIALLVKSDKTVYEPVFHIHNLCKDSEAISLNVPIDALYIYADDTRNEYLEVSRKFKENIYIPINGDVSLTALMENLKKYFDITCFKANLLQIMVYLAVWSGKEEIYDDVKHFVENKLNDCPEMFGTEIVRKEFIETLPKSIDECEKMRAIVREQEEKLKLTKLPHREMII
jgi:hypothetical protein